MLDFINTLYTTINGTNIDVIYCIFFVDKTYTKQTIILIHLFHYSGDHSMLSSDLAGCNGGKTFVIHPCWF